MMEQLWWAPASIQCQPSTGTASAALLGRRGNKCTPAAQLCDISDCIRKDFQKQRRTVELGKAGTRGGSTSTLERDVLRVSSRAGNVVYL